MSSVQYIEPRDIRINENVDFIEFPEQVPLKVEEVILIEKKLEIEQLFGIAPRRSFAGFESPKNFSLKNIFMENVISPKHLKEAIDHLDEIHYGSESEDEDEEGSSRDRAFKRLDEMDEEEELNELEKIFSMIFKIEDLNEVLLDVKTRMSTIIKP